MCSNRDHIDPLMIYNKLHHTVRNILPWYLVRCLTLLSTSRIGSLIQSLQEPRASICAVELLSELLDFTPHSVSILALVESSFCTYIGVGLRYNLFTELAFHINQFKSISVAKRKACLQPEKTHGYQYLFTVQFFDSYVYRSRINKGH